MKKAKIVGSFVLFFFTFFIFAFLFLGAILICINNFVELTDRIWLRRAAEVSAAVALIGTVLTIVHSKTRIGETSFSFWFHKNTAKIIIGYILFLIALISIRNESAWTTEAVYDILSLQWMIFGLSLTIFLVWNVIIVEFLKRKQPKESDSDDLLQKYKIVLEKHDFSQEVEVTYSTIILLTINLLLLLLSTSLIYIVAKPNSVLTQNILRCSFFLTTNSIICLFLDILKPLKKETTEMLKNNNVTKSEINNAHIALLFLDAMEGMKEELGLDTEKYTQEEKEKLYSRFLKALQNAGYIDAGSISKKSKIDPLNRGNNNGKIERI